MLARQEKKAEKLRKLLTILTFLGAKIGGKQKSAMDDKERKMIKFPTEERGVQKMGPEHIYPGTYHHLFTQLFSIFLVTLGRFFWPFLATLTFVRVKKKENFVNFFRFFVYIGDFTPVLVIFGHFDLFYNKKK